MSVKKSFFVNRQVKNTILPINMPVFSLDGLDEVDRPDEIWIYC